MVRYDSNIIREFAEHLYWQASQIVLSSTITGAVLGVGLGAGLALGGIIARAVSRPDLASTPGFIGAVIGLSLVGGVVGGRRGYMSGMAKSFMLRLEAQRALCFVEIERNTRDAAEVLQQTAAKPTPGPIPTPLMVAKK